MFKRGKSLPQRKLFTAPLTEEEEELVRQRAHAIWKKRKDDPKISSVDDWAEAIKALKTEQDFLGKQRQVFWKWSGFSEKKLWDILQLLIVPVFLALGAFYLQNSAKQREQQISDDKARQETLVKYLDQMSDLINNGLLKAPTGSEKFIVAQSKTVIALQSLDPARQNLVIQFLEAANLNRSDGKGLLYEARLSKAKFQHADLSGGVFENADFSRADLRGADLVFTNLTNADLRVAIFRGAGLIRADLSGADLSGADLSHAYLGNADLSGAFLDGAILSDADLRGANLSNTDLDDADFSNADLSPNPFYEEDLPGSAPLSTNLSHAYLKNADFNNANLSNANLSDALLLNTNLSNAKNLTENQLSQAKLCKTKLPSGMNLDPDRNCKDIPPPSI